MRSSARERQSESRGSTHPGAVRLAAFVLLLGMLCIPVQASAETISAPIPSDVQKQESRNAQIAKLRPLGAAKLDWDAVAAQLSPKNAFRVLVKVERATPQRPVVLTAVEKRQLADLTADLNESWRIKAALRQGRVLSSADKQKLESLRQKYAPQQQELEQVLMRNPRMTPEAKAVWQSTIATAAMPGLAPGGVVAP